MKKTVFVIRVVTDKTIEHQFDDTFLECLRYAGYVTIHRDKAAGLCFDLHCPHTGDTYAWADMNAQRMRSFGYNAVRAPKWELYQDRP